MSTIIALGMIALLGPMLLQLLVLLHRAQKEERVRQAMRDATRNKETP